MSENYEELLEETEFEVLEELFYFLEKNKENQKEILISELTQKAEESLKRLNGSKVFAEEIVRKMEFTKKNN